MKTIFVSSTFKDMHYERDAIREITAPLLNAEARKYGDELDFCDLRWGINTGDLDTEEGSRKVLDVCLDEIDRCEPPMVVLLGYRYGWIPDAELIKSAAGRKQLELEDLERSVTALEIEYGALCSEEKIKNTLFYFREINGNLPVPSDYRANEKEDEKISALKNRIKNKIKEITGSSVKEYTLTWNGSGFDGVDAFAEMLAEDIQAMLMPGWKETEDLTPFVRERNTHKTFIKEKNAMFRARHAEAEKLIKDALSQPVTIIKGAVGSGKSTLLSHMAAELENTEWMVLPFISGLTLESNSARDIIENTVYFIEEELKLEHYINEIDPKTNEKKKHTPDEWRDKLAEMCSAYAKKGKKLLIMLDATDQLTQSEERDKLHFIPTSVSENIHVVMTCTTDFKTPGREYYTLQELNDEDKQDVISGILARSGRELSKAVINKMLGLKASDNPLYLSLLVQRLLMMNNEDFKDIRSKGDGMAAIEQHQLNLIEKECPDALDEMSAALLNEAGKRINEKLVSKAAEYLAVSRSGLRKKDLAALLGAEWTEVDFVHFINYMNDCFMLRDDGRYDFTHKSIRAGFLKCCEDLDRVNKELFDHFKSLETEDSVRKSEITYHAIAADDKQFFIKHIIEHENGKDQSYIDCAAYDTYTKCITDEGQWVISVLKEAASYDVDENFISLIDFCNYDLDRAFFGSQKELEIRLSILSANVRFAEFLCDKLKCKGTLADTYGILAHIHRELGSEKDLDEARALYKNILEIREQLKQKCDNLENNRALAIDYSRAAAIYEKYGDQDSLNLALTLLEKGHELLEQLNKKDDTESTKRDLAVSYNRLANIYEKFEGRENLEYALELHQKSLKKLEQLSKKSNTMVSKRELAVSYHDIGRIEECLDHLDQALELYQKALNIRETLWEKTGTVESIRKLSMSYHAVGHIYERFDLLDQALELYQKDLKISRQLKEDLRTAESMRELAVSYYTNAGLHLKLGDKDNLEHALELYFKDREINERLAALDNTHESKSSLAMSHQAIADTYVYLYNQTGDKKNLDQALKHATDCHKIRKQLNRQPTLKSKKDLAMSYHAMGRIYHLQGKRDLALRQYQRHLTMYEKLADQDKTPDSKWELAASHFDLGYLFEEQDNKKSLECAQTHYEKCINILENLVDTPEYKKTLADGYNALAGIYKKLSKARKSGNKLRGEKNP